MNYTLTPERLHQQCVQRIKDRAILKSLGSHFENQAGIRQRSESKKVKALIVDAENRCIDQALSRLPENASFELRRQMIREVKE